MTGRSLPALLQKSALIGTLVGSCALIADDAQASPPAEGPARPQPTQRQSQRQNPASDTRKDTAPTEQANQDSSPGATEGPPENSSQNPSQNPSQNSSQNSGQNSSQNSSKSGGAEGPKALPSPRLDFRGPMPESAQSRERKNLGLRRQHDGSYLYVDPYRRFTAVFNRDGTVQFADRWRRPDKKNSQRGAFGGLPRGLFGPMGMSVTGPAEWVMALQGIDRNARVKAELLARTREIRIALAISYTTELLALRLSQLGGELEGIWALSALSPPERRALLFQRWDECDETFAVDSGDVPEEALSEIDRTRTKTAEQARRTIESFIRTTLPKGHANAYSSAELRALNRRRTSHQTFAPYSPKKHR